MKNFKIYSSSAGSGKTYLLTKEYLKLALKDNKPIQEGKEVFDAYYFRKILAITFTNDAANEMKERIIGALRGFAENDPSKEGLLQQIAQELKKDPALIRQRAALVFYKIIYHYNEFSVSTIDSFVNRVVAAFTQELNIAFNYEVDLDTDSLLQNAVDRMLNKVGDERFPLLSELITQYATEKAQEGKNWNAITTELIDFSQQLLNEKSYKAIENLKDLNLEDFEQMKKDLKNYQQKIEIEVQEIAKNATDLIAEKQIDIKEFYYAKNGVGGYFLKNFEKFDISYKANSYVKKALDEDIWYTGKFSNPQIDSIKDVLRDYILEIEGLKEKFEPVYYLISALLRHLHKISLIQEISLELEKFKEEKNTIHISDTNRKIAQIIQNEPVPFIYERLGERYNHILIDEFQDTSTLQWHNLMPLIENSLAAGYFNLLVGDSKQAIYRWRGGEMEQLVYLSENNMDKLIDSKQQDTLLAERYDTITQHIHPHHLDTNYRSCQGVVDFNNDFFASLTENVAFQYPLLKKVYDENFSQKLAASSSKGGHVEIVFKKPENYEEDTFAEVLQMVQESERKGFAWKDIAILCRKNGQSRKLAVFLKEKGYDIISQDSLLLIFDEKVNFLISFLKVINNPEDSLAKSEALYLFYTTILHQIPDTKANDEIRKVVENRFITSFYEKLKEKGFAMKYSKWQSLSLYELVEEVMRIFKMFAKQTFQLEYLFRFLDIVLEFSISQSNNLNDFLDYWHTKKHSLCITPSKERNAITLTSIHRAKGMEYPVVIVPFADWTLEPVHWEMMWSNFEEEYLPLPLESVKKLKMALFSVNTKQMMDPTIQERQKHEKERIFIENINLLYVALTRPIYHLYLISKKAEDLHVQPKNVNDLLRVYLLEKGLWNIELERFIVSSDKFDKKEKKHEKYNPFLVKIKDLNKKAKKVKLY